MSQRNAKKQQNSRREAPASRGGQDKEPSGFNAREVSRFLNDRWVKTLEGQDANDPDAPIKYTNAPTKAWGSKGPTAAVMAANNDFMARLQQAVQVHKSKQ